MGLGFWDLTWNFGFRVFGFGLGFVFRVFGFGFRVLGFGLGFRVLGSV